MKIHFTEPPLSPFVVPAGLYYGRMIGHRQAPMTKACNCPAEMQVAFDFELWHPIDRNHREYRVQVPLCSNETCCVPKNNISRFLQGWLEDDVEKYLDQNGDIELDRLLGIDADIEIGNFQGQGYRDPYSRAKRVVPRDRLIVFE